MAAVSARRTLKPSVARFFNIQRPACCRKVVYRFLPMFAMVNAKSIVLPKFQTSVLEETVNYSQ